MDGDGVLQFASSATAGLANVIMRFAVRNKQSNCSRLATELFCASKHLELEQECDSSIPEVQTFLRRIEEKLFVSIISTTRITVPSNKSQQQKQSSNYARLIPFDASYGDVRGHLQASSDLQVHLLAMIKAGTGQVEEISRDIDYFNRRRDRKLSTTESSSTSKFIVTKVSSQHEDALENPSLPYEILRQHLKCECGLPPADYSHSSHLGRLLLSSKLHRDQDNNVQLDMLFFTSSGQITTDNWHWQDIRLLLTRQAWDISTETQDSSSKKKKARFADESHSLPMRNPGKQFEEVPYGEFCRFLIRNDRSRLRFGIIRGRLHVSDPCNEGIERFVIPPSVALSTVLKEHRLDTRMRVTLAYILASSVWQYYNSDWMKSVWTSETIHFITEHNIEDATTDLYITKPYLSVQFDESSKMDKNSAGAVHQDPTILALGIMLVEIGRGTALQRPENLYPDSSPSGKLNSDWTQASILVNSKKLWPGFDSTTANSSSQMTELESGYRQAVKNCLDPKLFKKRATNPNEDQAKDMKNSREVLYRSVVTVLETLMRDSKYMDDIDNEDTARVGKRQQSSKSVTQTPSPVFMEDPVQLKDRSRAEQWLDRMDLLQRKLNLDIHSRPTQDRIRVAVIDTGCDVESEFFHGKRGRRLPRNFWTDFVDESVTPIDEDGHGTAMVSLVMNIAPQADVYVARVARRPQDLDESVDNVAQVCSLKQMTWNMLLTNLPRPSNGLNPIVELI